MSTIEASPATKRLLMTTRSATLEAPVGGRTVAKSKNTRGPGRPQNETPPEPSISARPTPELARALDAYVKKVRPKTTRSAVILDALEFYLTEKGAYPLPEGEQ